MDNNCIEKYNINDIVLSGGVAQNIKAMQALANLILLNHYGQALYLETVH